MNARTERQITEMKNQTIGVELEITCYYLRLE